MIISASRRTDIPAFFGEWFYNRLKEKRVLVRNPRNPGMITEIPLDPGLIECIVFWTKNPENFFQYLPKIDRLGYRYYFQFTLTPYDASIERNLDKSRIIRIFTELSRMIGRNKVIWRYDPILVNNVFTVDFHRERFESLCARLSPYTEKCVISFIDSYPFLKKEFDDNNITALPKGEMTAMAELLSSIAGKYDMPLFTCCEKIDLERFGIRHNRCIDGDLIERLFNVMVTAAGDPSQRSGCGCHAGRDIGTYNTCLHGCAYCYARRGTKPGVCDPASPLLCDTPKGNERIIRLELTPVTAKPPSLFPPG
ncbi:MAG: DUF1848 domain-containing protein [Treponema sp.]|jgi:hypothetical protein|nr:DUF1848 domain-containing protein [Treponema sp.]